MPIRSFSLNSREFYEALCEPRERPWIAAGSLLEPRWPRRPAALSVLADSDDAGAEAFEEWVRHVEAGRIG